MKRILLLSLFLFPFEIQVVLGQGTVRFGNRLPPELDARVTDTDGVTPLSGTTYLAQLYGAVPGTALVAIGDSLPFRTGIGAGYIDVTGVGTTRVIPGVAEGGIAEVQIRVWEAARGANYEEALMAGGKVGASAVLRVPTGGGLYPPTSLIGLPPFQLRIRVADPFAPSFVAMGRTARIDALCLLRDGKVLVGGDFVEVNGNPRRCLVRLHPDGSLDTEFQADASGVDRPTVAALAVQADGKILVGGRFTSLGGYTRNNLARLHPDGRIDETFNPTATGSIATWVDPEVRSIALEPDGRILVAGTFTILAGHSRTNLGRIDRDGRLDAAFDPAGNYVIATLLVQPDGGIMVGGKFSTLGGQKAANFARLMPDGTLDPRFGVSVLGGAVEAVLTLPDGRVLLGGTFDSINNAPRKGLGCVAPDGSILADFDLAQMAVVSCLVEQADGRILVGGRFASLGGKQRQNLARLYPDGRLDDSFTPTAFEGNGNGSVNCLAVQSDGKIIVGGSFTTLGADPRQGIGRIENFEAAVSRLDLSPTNIVWRLDGTGPRVARATFQYMDERRQQMRSVAATRIPGGWQASVDPLPASARIRALGLVSGGVRGGSAWFVHSEAGGPPRLEIATTSPTNVQLRVASMVGTSWKLEFQDSLAPSLWKPLEHGFGGESTSLVTDSAPSATARFYRVSAAWAPPE